MQLDRFTALLEAFGADPKRWPDAERAAALAFAAAEPAAKALMRDAAALDALLDAAEAPGPSDLLAARLARRAPGPRAPVWRTAVAFAACAVFGLVLGFGGASRVGGEAEDAFAAALTPAWEIDG